MIWEEQRLTWWVYRIRDQHGTERICGYVLRLRQDGPSGPLWDAIVADEDMSAEQTIRAAVPLEEAKLALEEHCAAQATEP